MHHVLFVDDDPVILQTNQSYFTARGYRVTVADNASDAMKLAQENEFDCIVLAVLLPNGPDGFEICRKLRQSSGVPILFLTNLKEREAVYCSFASGGDDFLRKPYDIQELYLRVEARIRRYRDQRYRGGDVLLFPPLRIDLTTRQVTAGDRLLSFTGGEFDILAVLCAHPNQVLSPREIYTQAWKQPCINATHTVQVHMSHLRHKLEGVVPGHHFIQTVWGKGYLFTPVPPEEKENKKSV